MEDLETELIELMLGVWFYDWNDMYYLKGSTNYPTIDCIYIRYKGKYSTKNIRQVMADLLSDGLITSKVQSIYGRYLTVYIPTKALELLR